MAQYCAVDGMPADYHLVHLGARALGGAALVFTEMTCPSPDARITPGCTGLWNDAHTRRLEAHRRLRARQHRARRSRCSSATPAPKGSTRVPWEGEDQPLGPSGNWPLISASPQQYLDGVSAWSRAMTRADMDRVTGGLRRARRGCAAEAGFDWLELHCAHGYLLSAFISPLTNQRTDDYGGSLAQPPALSARGVRGDARGLAGATADVGAHLGARLGRGRHHARRRGRDRARVQGRRRRPDRLSRRARSARGRQPVYGRMYQTPFADRIRNEVGIATMAVGAISEADHVNSIIAAGRADLCAVARPHLANPAWTLHRGGQDRLTRRHRRRLAEAVPARPRASSSATSSASARSPRRHGGLSDRPSDRAPTSGEGAVKPRRRETARDLGDRACRTRTTGAQAVAAPAVAARRRSKP